MRILHLTDTHLLAEGLHYNKVDTQKLLEDVLEHAQTRQQCDAIVVSGDISEDGSPASYTKARNLIGELGISWGAPVVWASGNHDQRGPLRNELGIPGADGEPINYTVDVAGTRFIVADTSVPRAGWGFLGESNEWLRAEINRAYTDNLVSVVVLHHPPLTPPTELHGALRLADAPTLAHMLHTCEAKPAVILSGHYHLARRSTIAGIPVIVGAAVANKTATHFGLKHEAAHAISGYTVVTITSGTSDAQVSSKTVWVSEDGQEIFHYLPEQVARIAALAGRPDYTVGALRHWQGEGAELIGEVV
ncbi:MAG: metallophosphoesterase [Trueperella sp.]|nr:metallophosphoesterase [Trueperella sp.]